MATRIGIPDEYYALPLALPLRNRRDGLFELSFKSPAELALALRQHHLDGALLSSIDYAKDYAMYRIVPGVGISSAGENGTIFLAFRENLRSIRTLAFDPRFSAEVVLAVIVLAEKYDSKPQLIPKTGTPEKLLAAADCVLLVGNAASRFAEHTQKIDLVEEWSDITGLPFVHGFWASRENALGSDEIEALKQCTFPSVGDMPATIPPEYFEAFQYDLDDEAIAGVGEFLRMAFYHGILNDLPELKFHPAPS
ncbi:MAG TPA: MqnA/MqnD/SBP family protein [Bacteroidota bacterium]|nr:MqnA/MqnD/SBP family protein [Bacteroidota bacterium]